MQKNFKEVRKESAGLSWRRIFQANGRARTSTVVHLVTIKSPVQEWGVGGEPVSKKNGGVKSEYRQPDERGLGLLFWLKWKKLGGLLKPTIDSVVFTKNISGCYTENGL